MPRRAESPKRTLEKLRKLCLALPETSEVVTWGHPTFRVRKKIFCAFHEDSDGSLCIWVKVEPAELALLQDDERISRSRHARGLWAGLRTDRPVDWSMVRDLVLDSYALVAPKRLARQVEAAP